jgi:putative PIN family toxin of toxin-antitoxin system
LGTQPQEVAGGPRVVLDTSVVVSALIFEAGRLAWLRAAWRSGAMQPLVSRATIAELLRVLAYPRFCLTADEQRTLLADYLPFAEAITEVPELPGNLPRCRDLHDRPFLALAIAGAAEYLVTGDEDLLVLRDSFPVRIMTPADLGKLLRFI